MVEFVPVPGANYKHDYPAIFRAIAEGKLPALKTYRKLCKEDLFFLLYFGLERVDTNRAWLVDRIREVEDEHSNTLDLWAREHYKSTFITYGLPLQELIRNPEERICIFSHTRPIAKGFLRQIKLTLEDVCPLKTWFPDVFYAKPKTQAPKWSEDDGLIIKRKTKPKESSIEAWGLVDGQPTSKHYTIRIYDDCVTEDSVGNPEMIKKTQKAYELSQSLGTDGGSKRVTGTHYHFGDLYVFLKKKPNYVVRLYRATDDGTSSGKPVLLSPERLKELRAEQGAYVFSCQQLLNPVAEENQVFLAKHLKYYEKLPDVMNRYLLVDSANEKKKESDYTVMAVVGVDCFSNYYLVDMIRAKLNLRERWEALRDMWIRNPGINGVGWERYGKDADISYMEERQKKEAIYFSITELGGRMGKVDRIKRLQPIFEDGRFLLPMRLYYQETDLIRVFLEDEYEFFPVAPHDDMLDTLSRIMDEKMEVVFPQMAAMEASISAHRERMLERRSVAGV